MWRRRRREEASRRINIFFRIVILGKGGGRNWEKLKTILRMVKMILV